MKTLIHKFLGAMFFVILCAQASFSQLVIGSSYSLDFENESEVNNWSFEDDGIQTWTLGTEATDGTNNALYISYDYYSYEYMSIFGPYSFFYRTITVPVGGMTIEFDYKVGGVADEDVLMVGLFPEGTTLDYYDGVYGSFIQEYCCTSDAWEHETLNISANDAGNKVLVFAWKNESGSEEQPPAAIDNLVLTSKECLMPTALQIDALYIDGADISWTNPNTSNGVVIAYKEETATTWQELEQSGNSYQFTTLSSNTTYQVKVKAACSASESSSYTEPVNFTTLIACYDPQNLIVQQVFDNSAIIAWEQGEDGNDNFMVSYSILYEDDWTDENVTGTAHTIDDLVMGTYYQVKVRSICGSGNESEYIETTFATTCTSYTATLPFNEGFETEFFPPGCWSYQKIAGSTDNIQWMRTTENVNSGNGAALFDSYHLASGHKALLISPRIDLSSENTKKLVFSIYRNDDYMEGWEEGVRVWINNSPNLTDAMELIHISRVYLYEPVEDEIGWYDYAVDLTDMEYDNAYLLFEGISDYGDDVIIDDIKIFESTLVNENQEVIICEGNRYYFYGSWLTQEGEYTHTIITTIETDTLVTLNLIVKTPTPSSFDITICNG